MHDLFHGFGFLGALLLVAGSLRQAFLELQGEEFEQSIKGSGQISRRGDELGPHPHERRDARGP
jgi:hypothetical protein